MRYALFLIFVTFISNFSFAQEEVAFISSKIICEHQGTLRVDNLKYRDRISSIKQNNDTTTITGFITANCGLEGSEGYAILRNDSLLLFYNYYSLEPEYEVVNGDTFMIIQEFVYSEMDCLCGIKLSYTFLNLDTFGLKFFIASYSPEKRGGLQLFYSKEEFITYPIQYKLMQGDTINVIDKYKRKQGLWIKYDSLGRLTDSTIFKDDNIAYSLRLRYYETGCDIIISKRIQIDENFDTYRYYPNGVIEEHLCRRYNRETKKETWEQSFYDFDGNLIEKQKPQ